MIESLTVEIVDHNAPVADEIEKVVVIARQRMFVVVVVAAAAAVVL